MNESIGTEVTLADFEKLDLRVARIEEAQYVENSDKLLKLRLDLGFTQRTVFSGIRAFYRPEQLIGQLTIVIANLAPRKMRFGISEGMVLTANDENGVFILKPDVGAQPGQQIS